MPHFSIVIILLFLGMMLYLKWRNSPEQKGKRGELYIDKILQQLPEEYIVINDIILPTERGTTQIDHVVVSRYAVFAIETKNYRGEIYGDDNRKKWTQIIVTNVTYQRKWYKTYTYVTKSQFYNPVKQSIGHSIELKKLLSSYPHVPVVPVVVFTGEATFANVETRHKVIYDSQLSSLILSYKTIYLSDSEVQDAFSAIVDKNVRKVVDKKTHIRNLKTAELQVENKIRMGICPKCGGNLILRKGRYGAFFGCSNYPDCKFTTK